LPERDLVSIVIPCFNHGRFLGEAIESALGQSHPSIEIIVIDDGSTDDTAEITARYDVRQSNRGLPAARNAGIGCSGGEYLVFLDADDRLMPNAVSDGYAHLREHPDWAFVSGEHRYIGLDGGVIREWNGPAIAANHYAELLRKNYIGCLAAVMYRRAVFMVVNGFDEHTGACEDYELYLRIARSFEIGAHNGLVAEYRRYGSSMSGNPALMLATALAALRKQRAHVRGNRDLEGAFAEGVRFWRQYYGVPLAQRVREDLRRPGRRLDGLRGLIRLLIDAPTHLFA
jgi:glycosyltransferase involved in cell wall biosynthesis